MSWEATAWAMQCRVGNATLKLLLLTLANYANDDKETWHSQKKISFDSEIPERTLRRKLAQLVDEGLIDWVDRRRADGTKTTSLIRLRMEWKDAPDALPPAKLAASLQRPKEAVASGQNEPQPAANKVAGHESKMIQKEYPIDSELPLGAPAAKPKKNSPKHPIAENAQISAYQIHHAAQNGFGEPKARDLFTRFKNHHQMKGNKFANWDAAWRMWISNEIKFNKPDPNTRPDDRGVLM